MSREASNIADARNAALTRRVVQVSEQTGAFIEWWGFRAIDGRVWTLLAIRNEPMSQAEIARTLGVSRSLVNSAITELEDRGLVARQGSGRLAPYVAVVDVWPVISDVLRTREWFLLEQIRMALDGAIEEAESIASRGEPTPWDVERLRWLASLTELAQHFLRAVIALGGVRERRSVQDLLRRAARFLPALRSTEPPN